MQLIWKKGNPFDLIELLVMLWTRSRYSHVLLQFTDGRYFSCAMPKCKWLTQLDDGKYTALTLNVPLQDEYQAVKFEQQCDGEPYDIWGVIRTGGENPTRIEACRG